MSTALPDAPFFTVDGASTRDIDDALRIVKAEDGSYRVSVAIANPVKLVPIGSSLDTQARNLAASVYVREAPLHRMLPAYISEERASLVAGKARDAIVFDLVLDEDLNVTAFTARDEPITVAERLTYEDIPLIMANANHPMHQAVLEATTLSTLLLAKRRQLGALALYDMSQLLLTDEDGNLRRHESKADVMGNILVQEMMILTNSQVGAYLARENIPAIFRNHKRQVSAPESNELANLVQSWLQGGFDVSLVQTQFNAVAGKASYGHQVEGHYGLSLPVYMHATSPLRRYADLVNLRQLVAHLQGKDAPYDAQALREIAGGLNETITRQKEARVEGYKRGVRNTVVKEMAKGNLSKLANHEISTAVKMAAVEGEMPEMLQQELMKRMANNSLAFEIAQRLFFKVPPEARTESVNAGLAIWLEGNMQNAPSLVSSGIMLGAITGQPEIETEGGAGSFRSTVTVRFREGDVSYHATGAAAQKKLSIQRALTAALCKSIGVDREQQLLDLQNQEPAAADKAPSAQTPAKDEPSRATFPDGSSPKGQLMEWCAKAKCAPPVFTHSTDGPPHKPVFGARVELEVAGQKHEAHARGQATKKLAEAEVSWQLLQMLLGAEEEQTNEEPVTMKESSNPISSLQEWCQRQRLALPEYKFRQLPGNAHMLVCVVMVPTRDGEESFAGRGRTKQRAKSEAAQNAIASGLLEQRTERPKMMG